MECTWPEAGGTQRATRVRGAAFIAPVRRIRVVIDTRSLQCTRQRRSSAYNDSSISPSSAPTLVLPMDDHGDRRGRTGVLVKIPLDELVDSGFGIRVSTLVDLIE